jgi:hypothetical protein
MRVHDTTLPHQNTFTHHPAPTRKRSAAKATGISVRKIGRLAIVLFMSFLCWLGVGCVALEVVQLAGR